MKRASKLFIVLALYAACVPVYAAALININTASQAELVGLKGIGLTYAARIIAYRNAHGPFAATQDIEEIKGIGPVTFANIKDFITVEDAPQAAAAPAPKPKAAPAPAPAQTAKNSPVTTVANKPATIAEAQPQIVAAAEQGVPPSFPLGAWLLGLAGLVGLGALSVWHVRRNAPKPVAAEETPPSPDEFTIEG